jgi:BirA family biotin operon repressor/biotin-[acetyl-CoA-carboxylase] ligase
VHHLADVGLDVETARGRGYRLVQPIELLDRRRIFSLLDAETSASCEALDVTSVIDSTSTALIAQARPQAGKWRVALAEYQTGGRGRRGRRWISPFGTGLCLSLSYCFAVAPKNLQALSLVAGIGVMRALTRARATGLTLKWPNDIVLEGRKLGGILAEVDGDPHGPLRAVIGLGLNLSTPESLNRAVAGDGGLAPAGLQEAMTDGKAGRNVIAARLIASLHQVLQDFSRLGFGTLADEWRSQDFLYGRFVTVRNGAGEISGVARGVAPDGSLLLDRPDGMATVMNGDITLRIGT